MSGVRQSALAPQDCFVSVISVLSNDADKLREYLPVVHDHLQKHFADFEILLVDQCSYDDTDATIDALRKQVSSIRYLRLSSPVHNDVALSAGVENAIGDYVVLLEPGCDPVETIAALVQQCREGYDIVVGVSESAQSLGYRLIRPMTSSMLRAAGHRLPRNATRLRCLSRLAVNTLTYAGNHRHQFFNRIARTGLPTAEFSYEKVRGSEYRTLRSGLRQTMHLMVFSSTRPLRWISALGLLGSILAFGFAGYSLLVNLLLDSVIEGWTSTILIFSTLFALLFAMLAFFGEYLGRILDEQGGKMEYHLASETTSSVMLREDRLNIKSESDHRNETMYD